MYLNDLIIIAEKIHLGNYSTMSSRRILAQTGILQMLKEKKPTWNTVQEV